MKSNSKIIRRSIAIPSQLFEDVLSVSPPELKPNFNRLVINALRDFSARKKKEAFESQMAQMAADPGIRGDMQSISVEFTDTERDGLTND